MFHARANCGRGWYWDETPDTGFRAELIVSEPKRREGSNFLPVEGVTPSRLCVVTSPKHRVLYFGPNMREADRVKALYDASCCDQGLVRRAKVEIGPPVLPDHQFEVLTQPDGGVLVVSGRDESNLCLLLANEPSGYHGHLEIFGPGTDAKILQQCKACSSIDEALGVVALLAVNEMLSILCQDEWGKTIVSYCWTGQGILAHSEAQHSWSREWCFSI